MYTCRNSIEYQHSCHLVYKKLMCQYISATTYKLYKTDLSWLEASWSWPVWPVSDTPKPYQMTQNLILSTFSFLPQVKIPNGLEVMICLGFLVYFGHFLKKGVFFGFLKIFKLFLESIYELNRGHFFHIDFMNFKPVLAIDDSWRTTDGWTDKFCSMNRLAN